MEELQQIDMFKEIINIGMGEAAAALSELLGTRVIIKVPLISVIGVQDLNRFFEKEVPSIGVYVAQDFHGEIEGRTILFYTEECSIALLNAMFEDKVRLSAFTESGKATLQEVGNIVLVSCISRISDMINMRIVFEMPVVTLESSDIYFKNMLRELEKLDKAIVLRNQISVFGRDIEGFLFVLLGFKHFELIITKLDGLVKN